MKEISSEVLFLELIRVSLGKQSSLSVIPTEKEWEEIYNFCEKHTLVGICFIGIKKLPKSQLTYSQDLFFNWWGIGEIIQHENDRLNKRCYQLQKRLTQDGFKNCLLKGQGNALLYNDDMKSMRQHGDIDIWIEGGFQKVYNYVQSVAATKEVRDNHIQMNVFKDTEVEAHYRPASLRNIILNTQLQRFFQQEADSCFRNMAFLKNNKEICVPTWTFNMVHQMVHIFNHFYTEGVGLRQLMDYYFLSCHIGNETEITRIRNVIQSLSMTSFATALMWVLGYVFQLERKYMLWEPNEKDGKILLNEIMLSGNFGQKDERMNDLYKNKWNGFWLVHSKTIKLWRFDHWAWFWSPIWRIYHYGWRKFHGFE